MSSGEVMVDADQRALQTAAEWFAQLHSDDPDPRQQAAWQAWLDQSPVHRAAWQKILRVSERCGELQDLTPDRESAGGALRKGRRHRQDRRRTLRGLGVLALLGLIGGGVWQHRPTRAFLLAQAADHHTRVGEVRQVMLPDGGALWLNTASAVNVDFNAAQRQLALARGEILIETAEDARPFRVITPFGRLQALGTRFSVHDQGDRITVAVFRGAVRVEADGGDQVLVVRRGQQVVLDPAGIGTPRQASESAVAWQRQRLVANHQPLADFIAQLRRHQHAHIHVDPAIANLSVVGSFPLDDPALTLSMLQSALPIRIEQTLPWWTAIKPR
jgi:transmembrane sensor